MGYQKTEAFRVKTMGKLFYEAAKHVPADKADWKPHENATSAQDIVDHIAWANNFFGSMIKGETPSKPEDQEKVGYEQSLERFKQSCKDLADVVSKVPDDQLDVTRDMPWGQTWKIKALLMSGGIHIGYHWGQIGYLQNTWGDDRDYHLES